MNILWITNILFPEVQGFLTGKDKLKASGGWMLAAAEALMQQNDNKLTVASLSSSVNKLTRFEGERIVYYVLPYGKGNHRRNHEYEPLWKEVNTAVKPDVVHLHGTEYTHGLAYIEACGTDNVCVSIQGLVSAYYSYYYDGISLLEILKAMTPASIFRGGILRGYKDFKHRGECEKEILRRVHHVIGRTSWDRDRIWAINPDAEYHYGGEILRKEFYSNPIWKYDNCIPHSIFLSQAGMPLKGLHQVLKAMPLVKRYYPDANIRIAGRDISRSNGWKDFVKISDYGNIIRKMMKKYHLRDSIVFTGRLDSEGMRNEYLKCNVFICPSSIENSPNSLGEAQILGVPVLASYVGGIPDMMRGDEDHLYRFEEVEMLAHKIVQLFDLKDNIDTERERQYALKRHNPEGVVKELMNIYRSVVNVTIER